MSAEIKTPTMCPYCGDEDLDVLGTSETGLLYFRCPDCEEIYAIRKVTKKVRVIVQEGAAE